VNFVVFPPSTSLDSSNSALVAISPSIDAYIGHITTSFFGSAQLHAPSLPFCPGLEEWITNRHNGVKNMEVVGNGHGGWWGCSYSGKQQWNGLSNQLVQCLKPGNPHGEVEAVALGVRDSYVVVFEDQHLEWDLKGSYDKLDKKLGEMHGEELYYVSLNPYCAGQFFVVFSDMTASYAFAETDVYHALEKEMLQVARLRFVVESPTAKESGTKEVERDSEPKPELEPEPQPKEDESLVQEVIHDLKKDMMKDGIKDMMNM
jgi:hypothetical protein